MHFKCMQFLATGPKTAISIQISPSTYCKALNLHKCLEIPLNYKTISTKNIENFLVNIFILKCDSDSPGLFCSTI